MQGTTCYQHHHETISKNKNDVMEETGGVLYIYTTHITISARSNRTWLRKQLSPLRHARYSESRQIRKTASYAIGTQLCEIKIRLSHTNRIYAT